MSDKLAMPARSIPPDMAPATVQAALDAECVVSAMCGDCENISHLDLAKLTQAGYGETALRHLPLRCLWGSQRYQISVS
jgi:hypothetical protein